MRRNSFSGNAASPVLFMKLRGTLTGRHKSAAPGQGTRPTRPVGRVPSRGDTSVVMYMLSLLLALASVPLRAQVTENYSFAPGLAIPDGNATGASDSHV